MTAVLIVIAVVVVLALIGGAVLVRSRRGPRAGAATTTTAAPTRPKPKPKPKSKPAAPAPAAKPVARPEARPESVSPADEDPATVVDFETVLDPEVVHEAQVEPSYRSRLGGVRGLFSGAVSALRGGKVDDATWESLEEALIRADVGVGTTEALLGELRQRVEAKEISSGDDLLAALGHSIRALLDRPESRSLRFDERAGYPDVWLVVGVNGVGKTTTIGKLARREVAAGHSVLLAAGDTFRAAAADQLAMWAERSGADIVRGAEGGDPSAIVFDAVQRAAARGNDLVLADTAGRLHTKLNLVEELKKIRRVAGRDPGNVTEVLLVLDATTGQNALVQARQFTEAVTVTGIVLTKLDGTAKGGIVIAVEREWEFPSSWSDWARAPTTWWPSTPTPSSMPCSPPDPARSADPAGTADTGPRGRQGMEALGGDDLAAVLAHAVGADDQPVGRPVEIVECSFRLLQHGGDAGTLEGDGGALGVMLVVGVRPG